MSLILEALRKSEAERRLGSAPGVLAAMPVLRVPAPRSRWPLALAGIAALIAVLALAWWWTRPPPPIARSTATRLARNAANTNASSDLAMHTANDTASASDAARTSQNLPTITLPAISAAQPIAVAAPAPTKTAAPVLPRASMPEQTAANAIASMRPTIDPATPLASTATKPDTKAVAPAPSTTQAMPAEPVLISVSDLPADERGNVPALKVSMHVYADDPAQRFMIVNGQRVGEGAQIADGVVIVRIRRDGAEIDLHGRRLLLPKP